ILWVMSEVTGNLPQRSRACQSERGRGCWLNWDTHGDDLGHTCDRAGLELMREAVATGVYAAARTLARPHWPGYGEAPPPTRRDLSPVSVAGVTRSVSWTGTLARRLGQRRGRASGGALWAGRVRLALRLVNLLVALAT